MAGQLKFAAMLFTLAHRYVSTRTTEELLRIVGDPHESLLVRGYAKEELASRVS